MPWASHWPNSTALAQNPVPLPTLGPFACDILGTPILYLVTSHLTNYPDSGVTSFRMFLWSSQNQSSVFSELPTRRAHQCHSIYHTVLEFSGYLKAGSDFYLWCHNARHSGRSVIGTQWVNHHPGVRNNGCHGAIQRVLGLASENLPPRPDSLITYLPDYLKPLKLSYSTCEMRIIIPIS